MFRSKLEVPQGFHNSLGSPRFRFNVVLQKQICTLRTTILFPSTTLQHYYYFNIIIWLKLLLKTFDRGVVSVTMLQVLGKGLFVCGSGSMVIVAAPRPRAPVSCYSGSVRASRKCKVCIIKFYSIGKSPPERSGSEIIIRRGARTTVKQLSLYCWRR
jgi:hypothetical protein